MSKNLHIIGLAGRAGSGKTSVAEAIVPKGSFDSIKYGAKWDHIFFSLPLYEMFSAKKNIEGHNKESRIKYAIHETLFDLYGKSPIGIIPDYDDLVAKVNEIYNLKIDSSESKPRSFLQKAGDICKEGYPDCFARWAIRKSHLIHSQYLSSLEEDEEEKPFYVIISDVRYTNEANSIIYTVNGKVIYFDASDDTLSDRLLKRDGQLMNDKQSSHSSEQSLIDVKDLSSIIINTDNMSVEDQVQETIKSIGVQENAQDK